MQAGLAKALQNKKPAGKVGVDGDVHTAHLEEKAGMADEGHTHVAIRDQLRLVGFAGAGRDCGMPHQARELTGSLAKCWIF